MKALNEIKLPRVAETSNFRARQSEQMNQLRLNQNFREIAAAVYEAEEAVEALPDQVLARVITPEAYVTDTGADGLWEWRKWSDGQIEAWTTTIAVVKNCQTASGGLYYADMSVDLPQDLFDSITNASVAPVSAEDVFVMLRTVAASALSVRIFCTTSANVSVSLCVFAIGK